VLTGGEGLQESAGARLKQAPHGAAADLQVIGDLLLSPPLSAKALRPLLA